MLWFLGVCLFLATGLAIWGWGWLVLTWLCPPPQPDGKAWPCERLPCGWPVEVTDLPLRWPQCALVSGLGGEKTGIFLRLPVVKEGEDKWQFLVGDVITRYGTDQEPKWKVERKAAS